MNTITTSSIVLLLSALYLWRMSARENNIGKELFGMLLLTPLLFYSLFYSSASPTLISVNATATQEPSSEVDTSPSTSIIAQNPIEQEALTLSPTKVPKINIQATGGPQINILSPANGQIFSADTVQIGVKAQISDPTDPNPIVSGVGTFTLLPGYNAIVVAAVNKNGQASSRYVIVKKL